MIVDPSSLSSRDLYFLMTEVIVPRPIGFVSTRDSAGRLNLAPFSYFNGVTSSPPLVSICVGFKRVVDPDGSRKIVPKDTARNILETGEFVVNVVTEELAEAMNRTAAEYPHGMSEFEVTGLSPAPCEVVSVPRVAESPVALECRLFRHVDLGEARIHMLIGEVLRFHVGDGVLDSSGQVDAAALRPVGRMGRSSYTRAAAQLFELARPVYPARDEGE